MDTAQSRLVREGIWWLDILSRPRESARLGLASRCLEFTALTVNLVSSWLLLGYLRNHRNVFVVEFDHAMALLRDRVFDILLWLDHWPVGLKLNTALSHFFASRLGQVIGYDVRVGSWVLRALEASTLGGLATLLGCVHDLLGVVTLQARLCYWSTRIIIQWQMETLHSLWNLFRGKRWNVLRQRTDSYEYELDQLFLGTLLFTVSAFLAPTVLTYHALFAAIAAAITVMQRGLGGLIDMLHSIV